MLNLIITAINNRRALLATLHLENTTCYRIFHGATEGCPGLSIDRYGPILLFQTWREPLALDTIETLSAHICTELELELLVVWNHRQKRGQVQQHPLSTIPQNPIGLELGIQYDVRPIHAGIDPLLFLDFRAARRWVMKHARNHTILNLFSYTCGIGSAACAGEAKNVCNVDFSTRSLDVGIRNAKTNGFPSSQFLTVHDDVFPVIRQFSGLGVKGRAARRKFQRRKPQQFDLVVLDPPRLAKSPFGKVDLVHDYPSLFKPALLCVKPGGRILATNNVASVSEEKWHAQLKRSAEKIGIHFQQLTALRPEADFPSPDRNWPLKMVICQL